MRTALQAFRGEIGRVNRYVILMEQVINFASSLTPSPSLPDAEKLSREIRTAGSVVFQTSFDGALLNLVAGFEQMVVAMTTRFLERLPRVVTEYKNLHPDIQASNERYTGEVLARRGNPRYMTIDRAVLVRNLHQCHTGQIPYALNADAICTFERNLGSGELAEFLGRLGLGDLWRKVGGLPNLQGRFGTHRAEQTARVVRDKLDEIVDSRNQVAHKGASYTAPGPSVILEYAEFLGELAAALVAVCESHLSEIALHSSSGYAARAETS